MYVKYNRFYFRKYCFYTGINGILVLEKINTTIPVFRCCFGNRNANPTIVVFRDFTAVELNIESTRNYFFR